MRMLHKSSLHQHRYFTHTKFAQFYGDIVLNICNTAQICINVQGQHALQMNYTLTFNYIWNKFDRKTRYCTGISHRPSLRKLMRTWYLCKCTKKMPCKSSTVQGFIKHAIKLTININRKSMANYVPYRDTIYCKINRISLCYRLQICKVPMSCCKLDLCFLQRIFTFLRS